MKNRREKAPPKKLSLHRETLQTLPSAELDGIAGAAPTNKGPHCNTFSEPSVCPTCLCT